MYIIIIIIIIIITIIIGHDTSDLVFPAEQDQIRPR